MKKPPVKVVKANWQRDIFLYAKELFATIFGHIFLGVPRTKICNGCCTHVHRIRGHLRDDAESRARIRYSGKHTRGRYE